MTIPAHATPALAEADRLMTVCNSCRYCEGLCAVFPAMEERRAFADGDLTYLANLCHGCGACYVDCQFADPHEFNVNVPRVLATVREQSYARYAWPGALEPLFRRNGLTVALITSGSVAAFILGFVGWHDRAALVAQYSGPGAFYRLMPHNAMVAVFGAVFAYAILAITLSLRAFWRDIQQVGGAGSAPPGRGGPMPGAAVLGTAVGQAATLRNLEGGGAGCHTGAASGGDHRRIFHHLTTAGFLLCFAATSVATLYHFVLGREAPYPLWDLPVVLGTLGGLGLVIGPLGLYRQRLRTDPRLYSATGADMATAFLAMLALTGLSGLLLLALRDTSAMATLLAVHLGIVLGLFLTMPYGKFVHGLYRFAALVKAAGERRAAAAAPR